jgi:Flp pilus assembly pilin Flp
MRDLLRTLWQDESGQDLTEYALLIVLVALAAVASMKALAKGPQYRVLERRDEHYDEHVSVARFRPRPVGERLRTRRASATSRHN